MDKLTLHTPDKTDKNIAAIAALFPNTITEVIRDGKTEHAIDFDMLRQELSSVLVDGVEERYTFNWPDKRQSVLLANMPNYKTLRPFREESVNFDTTENLYIEGDNIEVLKLLQETYLGKVKMIYIDPPYNTGKDAFVYDDDFSENIADYNEDSGDFDEDGCRLYQNLSTNGRFHTDWLNMIYPRLKVAKDLLRDDGVIFISIDDNEVHNLRKICDEVFGAWNFVAEICRVSKTTSFRGNYFAPSKDYVLCYAKNLAKLPDFTDNAVDKSQFSKIETTGDRKGEYYRDDIAFYLSTLETRPNQRYFIECPDGEKVIPPGTTFPPDSPIDGDGVWRWSLDNFKEKQHLIAFKESTRSPLLNEKGEQAHWNLYTKSYLSDKLEKGNLPRDLFESFLNRNGSEDLKKIEIPFGFPKPVNLIKYLMKILNSGLDSLILDFFSGSATTAHAVMQLNAEDGGNRKFIMVQIPEAIDEKHEAYRAGHRTICDIGKERIRRAGKKINDAIDEGNRQLKLGEEPKNPVDVGFRVLKVDSTNMKDVYYEPEELTQTMLDGSIDNIKDDRTPEDLLFQVMLDLGVLLSCKIEKEVVGGKDVFTVYNGGECYLIACFDAGVTAEVVTAIAKRKPYYAVFRDSGMASDSIMTSFEQIFEAYSKSTVRRVL